MEYNRIGTFDDDEGELEGDVAFRRGLVRAEDGVRGLLLFRVLRVRVLALIGMLRAAASHLWVPHSCNDAPSHQRPRFFVIVWEIDGRSSYSFLASK